LQRGVLRPLSVVSRCRHEPSSNFELTDPPISVMLLRNPLPARLPEGGSIVDWLVSHRWHRALTQNRMQNAEKTGMWLAIRHRAEFFVFRLLVCLVECLPYSASVRAAEALATLVHDVLPRRWTRYSVSAENLRRAFSGLTEQQVDDCVYRMWVHLFRTVCEMVQAPRKLHIYSYRQLVQFQNLPQTNEALLSGRRVLLLGGHCGNWEISTTLFGLWGFRMGVVARVMDNPFLDKWFRDYRERAGHRQLQKKGSFDEMLALLQAGGMVGLLGDQDAGSRGLFVDFFGHPASTFKSIALLSLEYDAPIVVGVAVRQPDQPNTVWSQFEIACPAVIDPRTTESSDPVGEITRRYTAALEQVIRQAPEQYFWLHRRWKTAPRPPRVSATKTSVPAAQAA
jgi:Kdo2-lipid IVA lauroyltransferase/acyltransferase